MVVSECTVCYHLWSLIKFYVVIFYALFRGVCFNTQNTPLVTTSLISDDRNNNLVSTVMKSTSHVDVLDTRSRVSGGVESLVGERHVADRKPQLFVGNADDSVVELSRVVADLRLLNVVVDDCRVVSPVSCCDLQITRTDQPRRKHVYRSVRFHYWPCC